MPLLKVTGKSGELRAGGRVAAVLGEWRYTATPQGWMVAVGMRQQNDFLIDHGAEFELRLDAESSTHIATDAHVTRTPGRTDRLTIVGEKSLEKVQRYGSGNRQASNLQPLGARAVRSVPGGNGRSSGVSGWDPARGRILVR